MKLKPAVLLVVMCVTSLVVWGCAKKQPAVSENPDMAVSESNMQPGDQQSASESSAPAGKSAKTLTYTCPMHPEVTQNKPGKCPKCGMYLEAKVPEGTKVTYTCPMHPEVRQDKPGPCPKCGMPLEAKVGEGKSESTP